MSLVGYDVSSESDDDDLTNQPVTATARIGDEHSTYSKSGLKLSNALPKPRENHTTSLFGVTSTSTKRSIQISAPEIPILDSDDSDGETGSKPKRKKIQPSKSRSGLFAKLPAPMNAAPTGKQSNTNFLPYVFSKPKKENHPEKKSAPEKAIKSQIDDKQKDAEKSTENNSTTVPSIAEIRRRSSQAAAKLLSAKMAKPTAEDNDSDEDSNVGFFSYVEKVQEAEAPDTKLSKPSDFGDKLAPELPEPMTYGQEQLHYPGGNNMQFTDSEPESSTANVLSSDMEELIRKQGKINRKEKINFIDICADDALEGNKELLLKQISEEKSINRPSHSKKKTNAPGGALKRKHQLTYLVHQAKSRELELKNSWAQNRMSKQQTQSKYGF